MNTKHDILRLMAKNIDYRSEFVRLSNASLPEPSRTDNLCNFLNCSPEVANQLASMPFLDLLNELGRFSDEPLFAEL